MFLIRQLLEQLDTPSGHIVLLLFIFLIGIVMISFKMSKAEDILIGSFSALLAILRSPRGNAPSNSGKA